MKMMVDQSFYVNKGVLAIVFKEFDFIHQGQAQPQCLEDKFEISLQKYEEINPSELQTLESVSDTFVSTNEFSTSAADLVIPGSFDEA